MKKHFRNKYVLLGGVILLYSLAMIPLIVISSKQTQTIHTHAQALIPTPTPKACTQLTPANVIVAIDNAQTMSGSDQSDINYLSAVQLAAINFIASLSANTQNTVGLISYSTNANIINPLTTNYPQVQNQIASLHTFGYTCISCAIKTANSEIANNQNQNNKNIIVLLTNGVADVSTLSPIIGNETQAESDALTQANQSKSENIAIYPIGIGTNVNNQFLQNVATATNGQYFWSPSTSQLNAILSIVSELIFKGENCIPISNN